jgi:hypothetical protein
MSQTTRELRFEGPGRVKACGGEVAFVLRGGALSLPGAGEGPGSEQWLATPCAVVRWATGVHHVTVEADRCTLHVSNGTAFSFTFGDTKPKALKAVDGGAPPAPAPLADGGASLAHDDDGWSRIDGPRTYELTGWSGLARAEAAADVCQDALKDLRQLLLMMVTNVEGHGGEAAAKAVGGRRRARASCALAYARALATRDAAEAAGDAGASKALAKHVEDLIGGLFAF